MTTLVLICHPNMGIVDSWLPVLATAKEQHPQWRIVALIPKAWKDGRRINPDDVALAALDGILSEAIVEVAHGCFRSQTRLVDESSGARLVRFLAGSAGRLDPWVAPLARRLGRNGPERAVTTALGSLLGRVGHVGIDRLGGHLGPGPLLVCYDAGQASKLGDRLLRAFGDAPRFSVSHGLGVPAMSAGSEAVEAPEAVAQEGGSEVDRRHDVRLYAYGESHARDYRSWPGIGADRVRVVGVPRHDPASRGAIVATSRRMYPVPWDDAVLLISRPATSTRAEPGGIRDWLPVGRKIEQLRVIHRVVCERHGLRLLIRAHPKEGEDGSLAAGLPADGEGVTWARTLAHPLHLAEHLRFAIAFSSGVSIDLLSAGVPTIEFQDVTGATLYDGPDALRDAKGRILRTAQRRTHTVLPADDESDLETQVRRILTERAAVVEELMTPFRTLYAEPSGAVAQVVADLERFATGGSAPRGSERANYADGPS